MVYGLFFTLYANLSPVSVLLVKIFLFHSKNRGSHRFDFPSFRRSRSRWNRRRGGKLIGETWGLGRCHERYGVCREEPLTRGRRASRRLARAKLRLSSTSFPRPRETRRERASITEAAKPASSFFDRSSNINPIFRSIRRESSGFERKGSPF